MNIYRHEGEGMYIGSTIIVAAASKQTAAKLIREELDASELKNEGLNIRLVREVTDKPFIIYSDNGDY